MLAHRFWLFLGLLLLIARPIAGLGITTTTGSTGSDSSSTTGSPIDAAADLCGYCLYEVPKLLSWLPRDASSNQIVAALTKLCHLLPTKAAEDQCNNIIDEAVWGVNDGVEAFATKYPTVAVCNLIGVCSTDCCEAPDQPEQIHIATTGDPTQMAVMWTTLNFTHAAQVQYGTQPDAFTSTMPALTWTYEAGGWIGYLHYALLQNLQPDTVYYYRVGDPHAQNIWWPYSWSAPSLHFRTPPLNQTRPFTVGVVGDMGATDVSDPTVAWLTSLRLTNQLDLITHIGDISYSDGWQPLFDAFQRKVENIAAYVPYMTLPGNHEDYFDFVPYMARYGAMMALRSQTVDNIDTPSSGMFNYSALPLWYSFDYGLVHFVMYNTEAAMGKLASFGNGFYAGYSDAQSDWLAADLAAAAAPAARARRPWIVAMGHRPLYCSNEDGSDCTEHAVYFRRFLEPLFAEYSVDLVLAGHVHAYERTWPVMLNGTQVAESYANPPAPVYIVNGAAGSKEQLSADWSEPAPAWSAARFSEYGFGLLTVYNATTLEWKFVADTTGQVVDQFVLSKQALQ